ncbi:Apyrase [Actinidia chinensis var. chinensis]|uniref:Apyrase n=1 Tax=Actinidia chinensis var. chinensis TaxID=1590841 RepID=A0A2R6PBC1_ACTCC|nr:Apyrase [Actinidia chinensis var. chinensis]
MRRSNAGTLGRKMDSIKLHFRQNSPRRSNLFSRNLKNAINTTKSNILIFALITVTLALFCYVFVPSTVYRNPAKRKFRIVIDGGSTGTRIHVFEYVIRVGVPSFDFGENGLGSMRVNPGLSSFTQDPEGAGGSLGELVQFGKKGVPTEYWGETEILLMATAGMRMLDLGVQARILESCRKFLRDSGFKFQDDWASVISGSDEGVYAWVAANYALGTYGGDPLNTTGIIELGGASAQVTFISSELIPSEFSHIVKIGNITYNLYSHSLLQFGQNVAFDLLRESLVSRSPDSDAATEYLEREKLLDPCTPSGYSHSMKPGTLSPGSTAERSKYPSALQPRGNFSECRSAALMLLQKGKERCTYQHCYIGSTFIPKFQGS